MTSLKKLLPSLALGIAAIPAFAGDEPVLDKADTAWIMIAGLLVLFMTIPGIALFYAGMVRKKNMLSTVVHINAGIAGLVACLMLGRRTGYGSQHLAPANLTFAMIGACLLWFGWMGFNGGSGLAANERAVMAILVTQIAAAAGTISWMAAEWISRGKPSLLGMISGAVAGLVAITPASGFVEPAPALFIGLVAGVLCFWMVAVVKAKLGYDDSLDAFGVHGIGGMLGAVLTGFFATSAVTGSELPPMMTQVGIQIFSVAATLIYGGIVSFVILFVIKKTMGLRVTKDEELTGLDLAIHGERIE